MEKIKMEYKKMERLEMDLLTSKYTTVFKEEEFSCNAPHNFIVAKK